MKQPCSVCDNTGWVHENHADRPFEGRGAPARTLPLWPVPDALLFVATLAKKRTLNPILKKGGLRAAPLSRRKGDSPVGMKERGLSAHRGAAAPIRRLSIQSQTTLWPSIANEASNRGEVAGVMTTNSTTFDCLLR